MYISNLVNHLNLNLHAPLPSWAPAPKPILVVSTSAPNTTYLLLAAFIFITLAMILAVRLSYKKGQRRTEKHSAELNELKESNSKLMGEREWLLKEIHHRVKNNLQIVISLLNTQSAYLDSEEALLAVRNSEQRMYAMSLIHQKLYQTESLSCINIKQYGSELVDYLKDHLQGAAGIVFKLELEDISFDVSQALPLGLVMNEAITNAIKFAFPVEQRNRDISISLRGTDRQHYLLEIRDNGMGLPENFDLKQPNSLGLNLIKGLTKQLDGTFQLENASGCQITIKFERIKILQHNALLTENC